MKIIFILTICLSVISCAGDGHNSDSDLNSKESFIDNSEEAKVLALNYIKSQFNDQKDVNFILNLDKFHQSDFMVIENNEDGEIHIADQKRLRRIDQIAAHIRNFYLTNEPLASRGINRDYLIDEYYPAFERLCAKEVLHKIRVLESTKSEKIKNSDASFKLIRLQDVKSGLNAVKSDCINVMSGSAHIILNYQNGTHGIFIEDIYSELAKIIYELRNEKSMKYFGESYSSIYWNYVKKRSVTDDERITLFNVLVPARVLDVYKNKLENVFTPPPPLIIEGPVGSNLQLSYPI